MTWQWPTNMVKVLWHRFRQCFGTFTMLLVQGPHQRDFLDIYLTTFSESVVSEIQNLWRSSFFSEYLKFNRDFENAAKNWWNIFYFSGNCIWIGIVKLPLIRTGYFSSAANVLTTSPKIFHVNKRDFFQLNWLRSTQWIW